MTYVHYGSLAVAANARRSFEQAAAYLRHDADERRLLRELEHLPHRVTLATNARDTDAYDPNTRTIHWDPHSALRTTGGGRQSPALGLGHEIDHAVHDGPREWARANAADATYDTAEERRVIRGSELHAARTLGEGVRRDHGGTCYRVASPVAMALIA